jgi:hypothetical protein
MRTPTWLVVAAMLAAPSAYGANLDLSPGDDLRTLLGGLAAGDVATLADGVYEVLGPIQLVDILATEAAPTIMRAAEGAVPILEQHGAGRIIEITRSSHVRIEGITLTGGGDFAAEERSVHGVIINDGSTDISILGNTITNISGDGVRSTDGVRLLIRRNEVSHTTGGMLMQFGSNNGSSWLQDSVIENNYLHHGPREGIWNGPGCSGNRFVDNTIHALGAQPGIALGATAFGAPNVVEGNALWDMESIGISIGGSATVRNNVVFNTTATGIHAAPSDAADYDNVVVSFNTVVDTGNDGIDIRGWAGHTGMVLANNAIANPTGYAMEAEAGDYDDGNLIVGNIVTGLVRGFEELAGHFVAGHGHGDFQDAPAWNFYPSSTSALRDAADPSGTTFIPDVDFNGLARQASAPDVGAYEFGDAANPGWLIREGFKDPPLPVDPGADVDGCEGCEDEGEAVAFLPLLLGGVALSRRRLRV